jgi:hypothetical protein
METTAHQRLKLLALALLRERGGRAAAIEVHCPLARYRVDVAGYVDTLPPRGAGLAHDAGDVEEARRRGRRRVPPRTVLIECKQSRSDFLRDRRDQDRLLRARVALDRFRVRLEHGRVRAAEPELRRSGTALFPELEEWDYARSRLPAYRDVLRRLRRLDEMLHGETKFCRIARYALADRLYILAPRGVLRPGDVPPGWGLLESSLRDRPIEPDLFGELPVSVAVPAPPLRPRDEHRQRLLRNIAVAAAARVAVTA